MPWYAWVFGPIEFVTAFAITYPQLWSALRKWWKDFNSWEPVPGPLLRQQAIVDHWVSLGRYPGLASDRPHGIHVEPARLNCGACGDEYLHYRGVPTYLCLPCARRARSERIERGKPRRHSPT